MDKHAGKIMTRVDPKLIDGGGGIQLKKIAGKIMTQGLVPKLIEGGGMSLNIEVS